MESLFKVLFLVIMIVTVSTFRTLFLIGISQEDYRAAVRAGADIVWFCPSCSRPDADPVAESTRISESENHLLLCILMCPDLAFTLGKVLQMK